MRPVDRQEMDREYTVLITAAGTATSVGIIKYLSKLPRVRIVTTDTNEAALIPSPSRWNTTHYRVPSATAKAEFVDQLLQICKRERVDFLYPVHDLEIEAVVGSDTLFRPVVDFPELSVDTIRFCNDKWINCKICAAANLPVPLTWLGSCMPPDIFAKYGKLIRKPRFGVGSVGVRTVNSLDNIRLENERTEDVIYQTYCDGCEYTVDVLVVDGDVYAIARDRLETKMGVCTKARVFIDPLLVSLARQIKEAFNLSGLFCFQVVADRRAGFQIIDINPRCGGGTALTAAAGFPVYEAYFSDRLKMETASRHRGMLAERVSSCVEALVCRYYEEVVTQAEALRGTPYEQK